MGALLDPDRLRDALADARLASSAARRQAERLAVLDAEIAKRQKRLVKLTTTVSTPRPAAPQKRR
jgi:hypothetical protein